MEQSHGGVGVLLILSLTSIAAIRVFLALEGIEG